MEHEYKHKEITEKVIKAFYAVYNALGYGFLEKVYVQALVIELQNLGLEVARNVAITVFYAGQAVGEYFADLVVADRVIVEVKAGGQSKQAGVPNKHLRSSASFQENPHAQTPSLASSPPEDPGRILCPRERSVG